MSSLREKVPTNLIIKIFGYCFLFLGIFLIAKIYYPVAKAEIIYKTLSPTSTKKEILPIDPNFSIVIPKININSKVVKDVDPHNPKIYQQALTQGVAHALGSDLPGFSGNIFIFAHSASTWYQANQYNAIFYLINKLESNDEIDLYYQGSKYSYKVTDKKIVSSFDINYLSTQQNTNSLTLMTCWPPGTTLKRLVVIATPFQK